MSALDELNEKQESGLELTSLEFAVWYCTDRVCAENAAAELADYELRLDLLAKGATWEHEENERMKEELSALRAEVEALETKNKYENNVLEASREWYKSSGLVLPIVNKLWEAVGEMCERENVKAYQKRKKLLQKGNTRYG